MPNLKMNLKFDIEVSVFNNDFRKMTLRLEDQRVVLHLFSSSIYCFVLIFFLFRFYSRTLVVI